MLLQRDPHGHVDQSIGKNVAADGIMGNQTLGVLADFGLTLPASTQIRVWDSTAEVRYLVLPRRPAGTEKMSEAELAGLVTRDCMIGVTLPRGPPFHIASARSVVPLHQTRSL